MKVLILAGGFGTRLNEETDLIPKPLVKIGEKPILWHIMKHYSAFGYNEFVILLGYKGNMIEDYFSNQSDSSNWNITFLDTGLKTDTGGRIKRAEKIVAAAKFDSLSRQIGMQLAISSFNQVPIQVQIKAR